MMTDSEVPQGNQDGASDGLHETASVSGKHADNYSELEDILSHIYIGDDADGAAYYLQHDDYDKARWEIKTLINSIITKAHQNTTSANTMPLVSSYRAVDDMKKFANQEVDKL